MNLALGRQPTPDTSSSVPFGAGTEFQKSNPSSDSAGKILESRIAELAEQLGVHPKELASAIKPLIPPAKAAALDEHPEATGTLVDILAEDAKATAAAAAAAGGAGGTIMESLVGMDEPPE